MTSVSENPYNFAAARHVSGHEVEYRELLEARQGGVLLGFLHIDDCPIDRRNEFGGPPLIDGVSLYAPRYERGGLFSKGGFSVCQVNLKTKELLVLKLKSGFCLPYKKDGNRLYYWEGFPDRKEGWLELA